MSGSAPSIARLLEVMRRLRDPAGGCEWDRAQTMQSIVPHTLEEAHELADAVAGGDLFAVRDELGDLLFQVVFLARIAEQPGLRGLGITDEALSLLSSFDWPGNVRQLQNALFRAAIFCDGDALTTAEFPQLTNMLGEEEPRRTSSPHDGIGITLYAEDGNLRPLEEIEADVIRLAIGHYRGRMTEVARRLGIGRSTLYRKLTELGIDNAA